MRLRVLQHVAFESPGHIADWAAARGHELAVTRWFAGDARPALDGFDALAVMGGPMSVRDEAHYPWLTVEKRLIGEAVGAGRPVLGVCLGAQLVADALGARVYRNREKEIGWFPVSATNGGGRSRYTLPERFLAYHWHGETFDLPAGAVHLARSEACEQQMFAAGENVLALQFHLEMTPEGIAELMRHCRSDLTAGAFVQTGDEMLDPGVDYRAPHRLLESLLDRWCQRDLP